MNDLLLNESFFETNKENSIVNSNQRPPKGKNINLNNDNKMFLDEVLNGLNEAQKTLPCKYFYDETGSKLFEKICQLDEYYITRTELALLEDIKGELANMIGNNANIIEPGAGAGIKIRTLLNALESPSTYIPMDISQDFLFYSAQVIQQKFPDIKIIPIQGDFTQPVKWLDHEKNKTNNNTVFFPGSTIGNFEKQEAISFLKNMSELMEEKGSMVIGVDLLKDEDVLLDAYNDSQGTTAKFNENLLHRINHSLNANFNLEQFEHESIFNHQLERIEMHLFSKKNQQVNINGHIVNFAEGESIHTENSHKYSIESFLSLAKEANLKSIKTWSDKNNMFSIHYLIKS